MKKILITGGSGLVGSYLIKNLKDDNCELRVLSRNKDAESDAAVYFWDWRKKEIEEEALKDLDVIINLAGANIAAKLWTEERKKEILKSRTETLELLFEKCKTLNTKPATLISASAIGYYGNSRDLKFYTEKDRPSSDFLGSVCKEWEEKAEKFTELGTRVVKLRIGAVLAKEGGILKKLTPLFKCGLGASLGSGTQIFSYIHIADLVDIIKFAMENEEISGSYNAVSPEVINNFEFSRSMANVMKRALIVPSVPAFFLKMILGELSEMLINGNKVSSDKIIKAGYEFKYPTIAKALVEIFQSQKTTVES